MNHRFVALAFAIAVCSAVISPTKTFAEISRNHDVVALLTQLYGDPDNLEFYPGLFAEDRVPDSPLPGLLIRMVAVDAFRLDSACSANHFVPQ